jgi:GNAT superfamily N-acetyltransferase
MRLTKIFSRGRIINQAAYTQLQALDARCFPGCEGEFINNRDWWVIISGNIIVAYCGSWYSSGICMFNRAWVKPEYRGQGIQKRMIKVRLAAAKLYGDTVITYTTRDNDKSANNLIAKGFRLYNPAYAYAGNEMIYFIKKLG